MAINEKDQASQGQQQQTQIGSAFTAAGGSFGQKQATSDFKQVLAGIGGGFVAPGVGGEYFTKMRELIISTGKDLMHDEVDASVIALNRQEHSNLRFSVITLVVAIRTMPGVVGYHSLILEATGEKLKPEFRPLDNQQVRINRVTSDAYDKILDQLVKQSVEANFPNAICLSASAEVVPATVTLDKREIIEAIVRNAGMACVSHILGEKQAYQSLNLTTVPRDTSLVVDMATANTNVYDDVGNPQRASVQLTMSLRQNQMRNNPDLSVVNSPDTMTRMCDLVGFVNPVWAPVNQAPSFGFQNPMMAQQMMPQGKLLAQFVVTGVRTPYATSPAAVLLALSSLMVVCDNNNWIQSLLPKSGIPARDNAVDLTDIGALNVVCNVTNDTTQGIYGRVMDVAGMEGDLAKINQYITMLFRPGVAVAIDCPECAPQSWYLNRFAAAATGDVNARNEIIAAADELTDGRFSKHFQGEMFLDVTRVPLGYYMVGNEKRDIRDIDLTAVCNLFKGTPNVIHDYSSTFVNRPGVNSFTNLAKREGIITHALKEQCEITGYAFRCTFSQDFITAFSKSLAETMVNTVVNTPLNADQLRSSTPVPDFMNNAVVQGTNTFVNMGGLGGRSYNFQGAQFAGHYRG